MGDEDKYDVALSFAGEQRAFVNAVAESLRNAGVRVFYDDYEKAELWGKDLYEHLDYVYRKASRYCVVFVSQAYAKKVWTNHERKSAQARAIEENGEYVLPARFDDTEIPGLRPTVGYIDLNGVSPDQLSSMIQAKLGPQTAKASFPANLDRLYKALGIKPVKSKDREKRKDVRNVALGFYEALGRMTREERTAVAGVLAFGCPADLPGGIHISLDYLHRMIGMPKAEIIESLSAVRSLSVKVALRRMSEVHPASHGELLPDDKDILLSFWSSRAPFAEDHTRIAYEAVQCTSDHFCEQHGLEYVVERDFRLLSSEELDALIGAPTGRAHHHDEAAAPTDGGADRSLERGDVAEQAALDLK